MASTWRGGRGYPTRFRSEHLLKYSPQSPVGKKVPGTAAGARRALARVQPSLAAVDPMSAQRRSSCAAPGLLSRSSESVAKPMPARMASARPAEPPRRCVANVDLRPAEPPRRCVANVDVQSRRHQPRPVPCSSRRSARRSLRRSARRSVRRSVRRFAPRSDPRSERGLLGVHLARLWLAQFQPLPLVQQSPWLVQRQLLEQQSLMLVQRQLLSRALLRALLQRVLQAPRALRAPQVPLPRLLHRLPPLHWPQPLPPPSPPRWPPLVPPSPPPHCPASPHAVGANVGIWPMLLPPASPPHCPVYPLAAGAKARSTWGSPWKKRINF